MSSTTEQIKLLEERIAAFGDILASLQSNPTVVQTNFALSALQRLLAEVGKENAANKAVAELNAQLKAKEHELQKWETDLQKREDEVVQKQLTESISKAAGHLRTTANGLHSSSQSFQSTSTELQSTSTDIRSATDSLQALSIGLLSPSQGLQPTSDKLQSTSTELQSTTNDIRTAIEHLNSTAFGLYSTSEGLQEIQSTSKEIQSAIQGFQSSSKTAGSQLEALERLASDLAKTTAADTSALPSQHKQEVDGLKSTISKLETKINAWESGHKDRLADLDAKRQAAMTEIEQREQSLAKRKEELMSLEIEALRDLRAAGAAAKHVEARKQTAVGVMNDLEKRLENWRTDVRNGKDSLDRYVNAFAVARRATNDQTMRAQELCRELHSDIERFDNQIKSMEVRSGKLPEPRRDVWISDEEGSIEERVTPSTGKRPHQASSTSTGASPRKTAAKRVKPAGLSTSRSPPSADTLLRPPPPSSLARSSASRSQKGIGRSSLSKAPHDFSTAPHEFSTAPLPSRLPQRRPALGPDVFDPPAGQASSSFTLQSTSPPSGQGQAEATTSPAATEALAPQTGTQEDLPRLGSESEQESEVGPEVVEEVPEPLDVQLTIPESLTGIWNQLKLDETNGRINRAQLLGLMEASQARKATARPKSLLKDCANKKSNGISVCLTSKLRSKGAGNFDEQGADHPCKGCRGKFVCLGVKWFNTGARHDENAAKRWVLEPR
ncbi:MAG: hypothetical protein LQ344_005276 [Seirophora lacunosa]|nr:MAG: hypothetical protein LQ344_005276 [Seirophora lacunosa]